MLNYAVAFVAFFSIVARLGMDNVATREFIEKPEKVVEKFDIKVIASKYKKLYEEILQK